MEQGFGTSQAAWRSKQNLHRLRSRSQSRFRSQFPSRFRGFGAVLTRGMRFGSEMQLQYATSGAVCIENAVKEDV